MFKGARHSADFSAARTSVTRCARLLGGQSTASPGAYHSTFAGGDVTFSYTP